MSLNEAQKVLVRKVIAHPAYNFNTTTGQPYYTPEKLEQLYTAIGHLIDEINTTHLDLPITKRIQRILCDGTNSFAFNFDRRYAEGLRENYSLDELVQGRTAYGLLCSEQGANCIGFSETACILLNLYGLEAYPLIAKLLKPNQSAACHYVTAVKDEQGNYQVIDAERLRSCEEPEKLWELTAYQCSIQYLFPDADFCQEKIGTYGLGPVFFEFIQRTGKTTYCPKDNMGIDREERIPLEKAKISEFDLKRLEKALSDCIAPLFIMSQQRAINNEALVPHTA